VITAMLIVDEQKVNTEQGFGEASPVVNQRPRV